MAKRLLPTLIFVSFLMLIFQHQPRVDAMGNKYRDINPPDRLNKQEVEEAVQPDEAEAESVNTDMLMVINIPAHKVSLYDRGQEVMRFDIAIGQPVYKTPTGPQEIDTIIWNPWWIPPDSPWARGASRAPPGPNNPLGPVKMLMGQGIRLHGTNKDSSVGTAASHGCLRMHNENAVKIAWYIQKRINNSDDSLLAKYQKYRWSSFYVQLNYPLNVEIVYEPIEIRRNVLYIYPDIYGWARNIKSELIDTLMRNGIDLNKIDAGKIEGLSYPKNRSDVIQISLTEILAETPLKNTSYAIQE